MNNCIFTNNNGIEYKRVPKNVARKLFNAGETIVLCACNLRPFGPWHPEMSVNNASVYREDFDYVVNCFEWYNCSHPGEGSYASYYVRNA